MIHLALADLLLNLPQNLLVVWLYCRLLTVPRPKLLLAVYILVTEVPGLLITWVLPLDMQTIYLLKPALLILLNYLLVLVFTRGRLAKRLVLPSLAFVLLLLSEMAVLAGYELLIGDSLISRIRQDVIFLLASKTLFGSVFGVLCLALDFLWRRMVQKEDREPYRLAPLVLFPLSQCIMLAFIEPMLVVTSGQQPLVYSMELLIIAVSLPADFLLLRMFRQLRDRHALQQRQAALEHQLALQEDYYRRLSDTTARLSRLRHDINNQLQTAYALMDRGEAEQAGALLEELAVSLHALEQGEREREENGL